MSFKTFSKPLMPHLFLPAALYSRGVGWRLPSPRKCRGACSAGCAGVGSSSCQTRAARVNECSLSFAPWSMDFLQSASQVWGDRSVRPGKELLGRIENGSLSSHAAIGCLLGLLSFLSPSAPHSICHWLVILCLSRKRFLRCF